MFAPEYKKRIPTYIRRLGIVTAPTGAAVQDIRNISARRNPYVQLILYPALVQGEGAVSSIVNGIRALDALGVDVIIVGRGGGSIEDLWAFNEEEVARAIFACNTPVISAVGHETDFTICDFAADLRAPTPSAAAELAVPDTRQLLGRLTQLQARLMQAADARICPLSSRKFCISLRSWPRAAFHSLSWKRPARGCFPICGCCATAPAGSMNFTRAGQRRAFRKAPPNWPQRSAPSRRRTSAPLRGACGPMRSIRWRKHELEGLSRAQ